MSHEPRFRFASIEDQRWEQMLVRNLLLKPVPSTGRVWLDNVDFEFYSKAPDDLSELLQYDALLVDKNLIGSRLQGIEIIEQVHQLDFGPGGPRKLPAMLTTGGDPSHVKREILEDGADYVCWKNRVNDGLHFHHDLMSTSRTLFRQASRIRAAEQRGYAQAIADLKSGKLSITDADK